LVRVYLECNWSFYGDVHRAEKEQDDLTLARRGAGQLSQVGIANESDQVT